MKTKLKQHICMSNSSSFSGLKIGCELCGMQHKAELHV